MLNFLNFYTNVGKKNILNDYPVIPINNYILNYFFL